MARILVVDDDREIVRLVKAYLQKAGYLVDTAYNGEDALHHLRRERPDLLVLDLMLPDRDGWDLTRLIRSDKTLFDLPIIMLTARVEDQDKIIGLEIGADDYVTKPFNPREVVARVRALLRRRFRDEPVGVQKLTAGNITLDVGRRECFVADTVVVLTPSEFGLLQILMENPGYVFTRAELVDKALGYAYEGVSRTLDSHIKNLRKKLDKDTSKDSYIQTVYGFGYKFTDGE